MAGLTLGVALGLAHEAAVQPVSSPELIARLDEWLASSPAPKGAKRFVGEARDEMARALAAQERDAK